MAKLDQLFTIMKEQKASDLHLSSGAPLYLRINGEMIRVNDQELSPEDAQTLVFELLNEKQKKLFIENWELDCSYSLEGVGRFRVNVFMQRRGIGAVCRLIPEKIQTVQELSLPDSILDLINIPKGLVLVTGPTGSGKTTTLAGLIHHINMNQQSHIITIEDPIEFVHQNIKSLINQREVAGHTKSFANALRSALREDPDIILVGEMRDLETISLAMTAAETGHLVFGTLHTNSAHKTIDRIIDVFPEESQAQVRTMLSESLRGVVAQTLLPRADDQGRIACLEVLINTPAIANLIREGKTFQIPSMMQTGRAEGMYTFETFAADLARRGLIASQTANELSNKKSIAGLVNPNTNIGGPVGPSQNTSVSINKIPLNKIKKY